jgi:hypothetical protein
MPGDPHCGSKVWEAPDREIAKPGDNCGKVVAHRDFSLRQLSTTERIAATLGPACGLPMWIQFFRPRATGRMEFSARLVLSSSSGCSKKRVRFFQSVSAYWQALLSALEGNATDCAASGTGQPRRPGPALPRRGNGSEERISY